MAANERPILIKKVKKVAGGHHGGAWKVAYADFVTAMMAFFLLLWLLNSTTEEQRKGIADYFTPTVSFINSGGSRSMMDGGTNAADNNGRFGDTSPVRIVEMVQGSPTMAINDQGNPVDPTDEAYGEAEPGARAEDLDEQERQRAAAMEEERALREAQEELERAIAENPEMAALRENLNISMAPDGLTIDIVDRDRASMFESGSATPTGSAQRLLQEVATVIAGLPNRVSVRGHTDASQFRGGGGDNWALSAARANSSRRVMAAAGLPATRIANVVGKADQEPLNEADPEAPENRRISIVLLRDAVAAGGVASADGAGARADGAPARAASRATVQPFGTEFEAEPRGR